MGEQSATSLGELARLFFKLGVVGFGGPAVHVALMQDEDIPFDFAVSGKTLPAGDYYLQRSTEGAQVVTQLRSRDKDNGVYLRQTHPVQGNEIQADSKLVFNKYGNQYFLSQVWISGRSSGAELTRSTRERLLQHEMAKGRKPENINLAIRSK